MKLIDPSQRINVLWDNDDGTRYTEEMTIRRLLAVMSEDEIETIDIVRCGECKRFERNGEKEYGNCAYHLALAYLTDYCSWGERRES